MSPRPPRPRATTARTRSAALALLATAAACAHQRGTFESPVLEDLDLTGVKSVDAEDLKSKLVTQAPGFLEKTTPWSTWPRLDRDALEVDKLRIEAYYRERGYYRARVAATNVVFDSPGRVRVVLRVDEGAPVRVTAVEVVGLDAAPEAQAKVGELPLRVGEVFTEAEYDAGRGKILGALLETGWANAKVEQAANVLPEDGTATVRYEVEPGRRWRFGQIFVAGTTAVPRDKVRGQAALEVKPGEFWEESKLRLAQARVFGLGVFGGVRVARGTPDPEKGTIPVVVTVREAPFRTVRAGPSIGVESTRWEARALAGWTNRNAFGDLQRLSLDGRVGYAWLPSPFAVSSQGAVGQVTAELYLPTAISSRIDFSIRGDLERGIEPAYDFWSERLRFAAPMRLAPRWTFIPSYNIEFYQVAGDLAQGTSGSELACTEGTNICALSYFEQRIRWDGVDNPIETRSGFRATLVVQEGFHLGKYGYQYVSVLPQAEAYFQPSRSTVLAFRLQVGALIPVSESSPPPVTARFMAGGPSSMRGFNTRRLAPYALDNKGKYEPVGGNGVATASMELRIGVERNLNGALFLDVGNVSDYTASPSGWNGALDLGALQWAVGAGLRYRTPVGPVRVDAAVRLPTQWHKGDSWSQGLPPLAGLPAGDNEPTFTIHLSLGDSF
jgi:translocation and assembly module TamA